MLEAVPVGAGRLVRSLIADVKESPISGTTLLGRLLGRPPMIEVKEASMFDATLEGMPVGRLWVGRPDPVGRGRSVLADGKRFPMSDVRELIMPEA